MPLTDVMVRGLKPGTAPATYVDGLGLELLVTKAGTKWWRFRYSTGGKQRRISIGQYPTMGLAAARVETARLRTDVLLGRDPAPDPTSAIRVTCPHCSHVFHAAGVVATAPLPVEPGHEGVDAAVESYLADHRPTWKATTIRTYESAIRTFTAWASTSGILTVADLTARSLASFRAHAVAAPRREKAKGGSRHDVVSTGKRRSAEAVNGQVRVVKTMLEALRRAGRLPALTSDDISDNLRQLTVERSRPAPLRPEAIRSLLSACVLHDDDRDYEPIGPLVLAMLLGGFRLGEALRLEWDDIDFDEMTVLVVAGKTGHERTVDMSVSPALARLFKQMRGKRPKGGRVFDFTQPTALDARLRLIDEYGAPAFLWSTRNSRPGERSAPTLRSTCGCYLTCAPSIFHGASAFHSAARLGHSVKVAERHYLGVLRKIPKKAKTVEAAMEIEAELSAILTTAKVAKRSR
jgi:integrase